MKFTIDVPELHYARYVVEAESLEDAVKHIEMMDDTAKLRSVDYSDTLQRSDGFEWWLVDGGYEPIRLN